MRIELHIDIQENNSFAVDLLAQRSQLSKQKIKQAMDKGAVWLTRDKRVQRLRRAKKVLTCGDQLHLYYDEQVLAQASPVPVLIADEGGYSIWNKPYGMLSQGSKWGDHTTINRWAEKHLQPQRTAFTVHRLDRAANGLIILAHDKKTAAALSQLFQLRKIYKEYQAVVVGDFPDTQQVYINALDGKSAKTRVVKISYDPRFDRSTLKVILDTGRKHQIRRHLSAHGFPIIGDRLYGQALANTENLQLTARKLRFLCPLSQQEKSYTLA